MKIQERKEQAGLKAYPENISYSTVYDTMTDYNLIYRKPFMEGYGQGFIDAINETFKALWDCPLIDALIIDDVMAHINETLDIVDDTEEQQ